MSSAIRLLSVSLLYLLFPLSAWADGPVEQARDALEKFIESWNRADITALRETLNFPHITDGGRNLLIANLPEEFNQDFEALSRDGWHHSTFDNFTPFQVSADKVNYLVDVHRFDVDGKEIQTLRAMYIITRQAGKWGMQFRSGGTPPAQIEAFQLMRNAEQATATLHTYFEAFNARDNDTLLAIASAPQVLLDDVNYLFAADRSSSLVTVDFDQLRRLEDWNHSTEREINAIYVASDRVVLELQVDYFNSRGEKYRTVPALWLFKKEGDKWVVPFRSLMTPAFEL